MESPQRIRARYNKEHGLNVRDEMQREIDRIIAELFPPRPRLTVRG